MRKDKIIDMVKYIIISVCLVLSFNLYSQGCDGFYYEHLKQSKKARFEGVKTLGLYSASILLNGIGDGLNDGGNKTSGHLLNAGSICLLISSPFILNYDKRKWYYYLASYTSLRIGLFDVAYNKTRGLPFNYTGSTSLTDKFYNKMGGKPTFTRVTFFTLGLTISIKEFK